jgi:F-type H+-transporting ATPase subunit b
MLADPTFWAFVGLVLFFVVIFFAGAPAAMIKSLDQRAETIRNELDEARRLREEAQEMLASYERRQREAAEEAERIVEQARRDAERLREDARKDLEDMLERRAEMAETRIAQAEAQAAKEVRAMAADLATAAAEELLKSGLSKTDRNKIVKADTADLPKRFN